MSKATARDKQMKPLKPGEDTVKAGEHLVREVEVGHVQSQHHGQTHVCPATNSMSLSETDSAGALV